MLFTKAESMIKKGCMLPTAASTLQMCDLPVGAWALVQWAAGHVGWRVSEF